MMSPEQLRQFRDRFSEAMHVDDDHWRCSGPSKSITRQVLAELDISEADRTEFLLLCESSGGKCCDCEIALNILGDEGTGDEDLEIHHGWAGGETIVSNRDVHLFCKCCHGTTEH